MKRAVALSTAIISIAALAGCGTSNSTGNTNNSTQTPSSAVTYPLNLTDQANRKVTISKQPMRIASVTEGTDEMLSGLVDKSKLVLVTSLASDPTQSNVVDFVKGIPSIQSANAEQIIASKPDIALLASYTKPGVVDQIEKSGIVTFEFANFNSISDIENNIQVLGKVVGEPDKANQMVTDLENKLSHIKQAVSNEKKLSVLEYSSFGYAAGSGTTVNDMIQDAGGTNAAAEVKGWGQITDEQIVKMNPDIIIYTDAGLDKKLYADKGLMNVPAIKNHKVIQINSADLMSVSQYIYKGVEDIAKALYPDAQIQP